MLFTPRKGVFHDILKGDWLRATRSFFKPEQAATLVELSESERLRVWINEKKGNDGDTEHWPNGRIDVWINAKVLKSKYVCWRVCIMVHELVHALHFAGVDPEKNPVPDSETQGEFWKDLLERSVKKGKVKECAKEEVSPVAGCIFEGDCMWCLPEESETSPQIVSIPTVPEEKEYRNGSNCLYCSTKKQRATKHLDASPVCQRKYIKKYGITGRTIFKIHHAKRQRWFKQTQ